MIKTVGSVCSGIEAASVAWQAYAVEFKWFSEIASFQSDVLKSRFPEVMNIGDMNEIPEALINGEIEAPDLICGGTPCQAFSLAGRQKGLEDERGNLTLKFVDIIEANDLIRKKLKKEGCAIFWENVEGVLKDKTNAFGCLISLLAGLKDIISFDKWPAAGLLEGPKRNVAWRVLDAKYFGLPQQRRRLYVLAGGKTFHPEQFLFELDKGIKNEYPNVPLRFVKEGHHFEVFRSYADCLYAAYGTKWNGNAAAYNGSLFVVQDGRIRRLSPLECERLMGFPDDYTAINGAKKTNRYQALGNSWAVPVVRWIGKRLITDEKENFIAKDFDKSEQISRINVSARAKLYDFGKGTIELEKGKIMNASAVPCECVFRSLQDILTSDVPQDIYISPVGCYGILRRKRERKLSINPRLEEVLSVIASQMPVEEIESKSRIQKRGQFSDPATVEKIS